MKGITMAETKKRKPKTAPIRGSLESARLLTIEQACQYIGMGRTRTRQICDRINATRKLSERSVRYDKYIIDKFLDTQASEPPETA